MKRLRSFIDQLLPLTKESEPSTIKEILRSIILFIAANYDKDNKIPSLEFINNFSHTYLFIKKEIKKEEVSKEIEEQSQLLTGYGYLHTDEMDKVLIEFVKKGYLDKKSFHELLAKKNYVVKQRENTYKNAWALYHNSFKNNQDEFAKILAHNFKEESANLTLEQLQETVGILRELDYGNLANELIDCYVIDEIPKDSIRCFLESSSSNGWDKLLIDKLKSIQSNSAVQRSLAEITDELKYLKGWNPGDVAELDSFSEEDYYQFLISYKGEDLYYRVKACLQFGPIIFTK